MALSLDFTNMMDAALPHGAGITAAQWSTAAAGFPSVHARVHRMQQELGFLTLPRNDALRDATLAVAAPLRGRFDDVLLLGIGGSALGPIALRTALRPPAWNALSADARGNAPRLHVLDNVDPATIAATLHRLDLSRTLVLVVSKSGGTVETMAQYLIVRQALADAVGEEAARAHLVFVTDPEVGALRTIARAEGITTLEVPPNVGGRFSVLSPVGLLPAALIGIDIHALLAGAADVMQRAESAELSANLPGTFAMLQHTADTQHGRSIQVLMPYADPLRDLALWFVQLWAESLGQDPARRYPRWTNPAPRGGCHGSAFASAALHGGPARQNRHLYHGEGARARRGHPRTPCGHSGVELLGGTHPGRTDRHRTACHRRRLGGTRPLQRHAGH